MAWENGFFNSVNGDRLYNADKMNKIFEGLLSNGVFQNVGNKLAVQPNNGLTIQIATGRGWFSNHWVSNSSEYLMTLQERDVVLNRYAAICIKVDENNNVRAVTPVIKYSDFATNPVKPTMTRSELINEYCLAYVYIRAGQPGVAITAADIEDTRQDTQLCGWVTGLITQITPDTLYSQFTALFNEWFQGLVDTLDENTEAMLVAALPTNVLATLSSTGWVQGASGYTQSLTITGVTSTQSIIVQPHNGSEEAYSNAGIKATAQGTNTITFTAQKLPTSNVSVDILHMGV